MVLAENQEILSYCQLNHAQKEDIRRIGMQFACICTYLARTRKRKNACKHESIRFQNGPLLN